MKPSSPVVLLVEGDIIVRHPLAEYLRDCGFTVFEASNGDEAKTALSAPSLTIDAVLIDMATTGAGFELRHWISHARIATEVIMAGSLQSAVNQAGDLCNEGPALHKPYEHHLVLDHIRQRLAARAKA